MNTGVVFWYQEGNVNVGGFNMSGTVKARQLSNESQIILMCLILLKDSTSVFTLRVIVSCLKVTT